jgi:hypothetical protein
MSTQGFSIALAPRPMHELFVAEATARTVMAVHAGRPRNWAPWLAMFLLGTQLYLIPWPAVMPPELIMASTVAMCLALLVPVGGALAQVISLHRQVRRCNEARALLTVSHMFAPVTPNLTAFSAAPVAGVWPGASVVCRSGGKWPVKCYTKDPVELVTQTVAVGREHWEKCEDCRVGQ